MYVALKNCQALGNRNHLIVVLLSVFFQMLNIQRLQLTSSLRSQITIETQLSFLMRAGHRAKFCTLVRVHLDLAFQFVSVNLTSTLNSLHPYLIRKFLFISVVSFIFSRSFPMTCSEKIRLQWLGAQSKKDLSCARPAV